MTDIHIEVDDKQVRIALDKLARQATELPMMSIATAVRPPPADTGGARLLRADESMGGGRAAAWKLQEWREQAATAPLIERECHQHESAAPRDQADQQRAQN